MKYARLEYEPKKCNACGAEHSQFQWSLLPFVGLIDEEQTGPSPNRGGPLEDALTYAIGCSECDEPGPGDGSMGVAELEGWKDTGYEGTPLWVCPTCLRRVAPIELRNCTGFNHEQGRPCGTTLGVELCR